MPDNLQLKRPQDASKISLAETWEVEYWTRALGVSETQLREAVRVVGHSADAVRRYLHR